MENIVCIEGLTDEQIASAVRYVSKDFYFNFRDADIRKAVEMIGKYRCNLEYANYVMSECITNALNDWCLENDLEELVDFDVTHFFFNMPERNEI